VREAHRLQRGRHRERARGHRRGRHRHRPVVRAGHRAARAGRRDQCGRRGGGLDPAVGRCSGPDHAPPDTSRRPHRRVHRRPCSRPTPARRRPTKQPVAAASRVAAATGDQPTPGRPAAPHPRRGGRRPRPRRHRPGPRAGARRGPRRVGSIATAQRTSLVAQIAVALAAATGRPSPSWSSTPRTPPRSWPPRCWRPPTQAPSPPSPRPPPRASPSKRPPSTLRRSSRWPPPSPT
jgi:hypothetical protein